MMNSTQNQSLPVILTTHFCPQHHRMRGIDRDLIRGQRRRREARSGGPFFMWISSNSKMAHKNPDLTHGGETSDIPFQRAHADFASTDFGSDGYGGPCPPPGDKPHHYQITVFAVDVDKLPDAKGSHSIRRAGRVQPELSHASEGYPDGFLRSLMKSKTA